jgi:hypothetical protein
MSDRVSRDEALALINRIKSPHLAFGKFSRAHQLYDTARRPFATLSTETKELVSQEIDEIMTVIDSAITDLSTDSFESVLNVHQIKASSFGGQATVRRMLRGSRREADYTLIAKCLAELRKTMTTSERKKNNIQ